MAKHERNTGTPKIDGKVREKADRVIRFHVLTAVIMKSNIFWNVMPCILVEVHRRYRRTLIDIKLLLHNTRPELDCDSVT
jgi:hypothetical protein